ncbi:MAG: glycosyltransferase family 2 protein [Thaumarchaeota archaeon]|nr:glycosyltransferase family 2 protein [Nitrososphaerota archaeon]
MKEYWVNFTVKNGEKFLKKSIEFLLEQSIKPSLICVVDDGSTDNTPTILKELQQKNNEIIHIITLPDKGYDIRRLVHNLNAACEFVKESNKEYDYMLIGNEDVFFPKDYVERLIAEMEKNTSLAVTSGTRGLERSDRFSLPEGAGRFVRSSFFKQADYSFPSYYGYESWLLYKALQLGYKVKKFMDLKYEHARDFGVEHGFVEYGVAMRCLGYHPLFVLGRVLRNIVSSKTGISKKTSIRMLLDYLSKDKWKNDPYFHYFEPEFRKFVRNTQMKRILNKFGFDQH